MTGSTWRVVFRVDASLEIGTGHVMRCLTLADALAATGADCHFICRAHPGHMIGAIRKRDHVVHVLHASVTDRVDTSDNPPLDYGSWLHASWQADAHECNRIITMIAPHWLIVDHYALDTRWEKAVKPRQCRLLVIDDLADRHHTADLLLDQNLGRQSIDYAALVPTQCHCLIGPEYALLRPEFTELRRASLERRRKPKLAQVLVSLGGVDRDNVTSCVLHALRECELPADCRISVIMGSAAPWLEQIRTEAAAMPWSTEIHVDVRNMALLMRDSDLAIGAAGSSAWERCCMGLPALVTVLAANQQRLADALDASGAAAHLGTPDNLSNLQIRWPVLTSVDSLAAMTSAGAATTSGRGAELLVQEMTKELPCQVPS